MENLIPLDEALNNSIPGCISFVVMKAYYCKSQLKSGDEVLRQNSQSTWEVDDAERWIDTLTGLVDKATSIR